MPDILVTRALADLKISLYPLGGMEGTLCLECRQTSAEALRRDAALAGAEGHCGSDVSFTLSYSVLNNCHGVCIGEGDEDEEGSEQDDKDEEDGGSDDSDELLDVEKKSRRVDMDRWASAARSTHVAPLHCAIAAGTHIYTGPAHSCLTRHRCTTSLLGLQHPQHAGSVMLPVRIHLVRDA